jgi:hypothetical protein
MTDISAYGRKRTLCDACHRVLLCIGNETARGLFVPIVCELMADVLHIQSSLTPEEADTALVTDAHMASVIYSYCLQAAERASMQLPVCDGVTAEHYMGRFYDRSTGVLSWCNSRD